MTENQNPEQKARDNIDAQLEQAGWVVQSKNKLDLSASLGVAVREFQTDIGPADYVLFVDRKACGVIEAKKADLAHKITEVEEQTGGYAAAKLKWVNNKEPLPFLYESTGIITRFTDGRDPKPRSREVFNFHRPETLKEWLSQGESLRARLQHLPELNPNKLPAKALRLRDCQETAITNLEASFKADRPRALIQMATGAGKTYTAITSIYRLLKHAHGKRILFLVDTKNLGEQAEQEMMSYVPIDDNRKFTELYNVQRLKSSFVAKDSQVCISTIQRLYSILKDTPLDEATEEMGSDELAKIYGKLLPHPNPLMEQLANTLSQQAGKCLVIPEGEGYGSSLREFYVKDRSFEERPCSKTRNPHSGQTLAMLPEADQNGYPTLTVAPGS